MRQDIVNWLQSTGYDISMQTLLNITGNSFRSIVYHLVVELDPNYYFEPNARFEEDFVPTLKSLHYPFASQIDPKWLAAPASMHSWPFLLGALHWLVQMCRVSVPVLHMSMRIGNIRRQAKSQYSNSGHPTLQVTEDVPEEFDDPNHHYALAFQYYEQSYNLWLDGDDVFTEPSQALEERYGNITHSYIFGIFHDIEQPRRMRNYKWNWKNSRNYWLKQKPSARNLLRRL
jgi:kinetochore protein NDC80